MKIFDDPLPLPPPGCLSSAEHRRRALDLAAKVEVYVAKLKANGCTDTELIETLSGQVDELRALAASIAAKFVTN
jgi:hypothetical protein